MSNQLKRTSKALAFCTAALLTVSAAAQPYTTEPAGRANPAPFSVEQPTLGISYLVSTIGTFPSRSSSEVQIQPLLSETYLASIRMFAGNFAPSATRLANGDSLDILSNQALFAILGTTFGGDGRTNFQLPDLTGRVSVNRGQGSGLRNWTSGQVRGSRTQTLGVNNLPSHNHDFPWPNPILGPQTTLTTDNTGGGQAVNNIQPTLATTFAIATSGIFPLRNSEAIDAPLNVQPLVSGEPFLGQVVQFAGNFAPRGYIEANGQLLSISENTALFALLGTTYGGDGRSNFAVPDLRGRVPVHPGTAPGGSENWTLGEKNGSESTALTVGQMPAHNHIYDYFYPDYPLLDFTTSTGSNQAIDNHQPGLGLNYIINLTGADPSSDGGLLEPMLGEITLFAGSFAPDGWAFLNGQLLSISEYEELFAILGTTYGGNGRDSFALPDMRGRTGVHAEFGDLGDRNGQDQTFLTEAHLPEHTHEYVPEPTSALLLGLGGLVLARRRRGQRV